MNTKLNINLTEVALQYAYNLDNREAIDIAGSLEAKFAPSDDSECCKCDKSHAKADGAAAVLDQLEGLLLE